MSRSLLHEPHHDGSELYLAEPLEADGAYVREVSVPAQGPHRT